MDASGLYRNFCAPEILRALPEIRKAARLAAKRNNWLCSPSEREAKRKDLRDARKKAAASLLTLAKCKPESPTEPVIKIEPIEAQPQPQ